MFSFASYSPGTINDIIFLQLFICVMILLQYPVDDGSCSYYLTKEDCENGYSSFDVNQKICYWHKVDISSLSDYFPCNYAHPVVTFHVS